FILFQNARSVQPLATAVIAVPGDLIQRPIAGLLTAPASRILPLCFGGQAPTCPITEIARIVPGYVNHWHRPVGPRMIERRSQKIRLRRHGLPDTSREALVGRHGNLGLSHPETPTDCHVMRGLLIASTRAISRGATHLELPRWNPCIL